jgi:hypothetical protein
MAMKPGESTHDPAVVERRQRAAEQRRSDAARYASESSAPKPKTPRTASKIVKDTFYGDATAHIGSTRDAEFRGQIDSIRRSTPSAAQDANWRGRGDG